MVSCESVSTPLVGQRTRSTVESARGGTHRQAGCRGHHPGIEPCICERFDAPRCSRAATKRSCLATTEADESGQAQPEWHGCGRRAGGRAAVFFGGVVVRGGVLVSVVAGCAA
jgi:hypothetical protein